jgi:hypothetical protein
MMCMKRDDRLTLSKCLRIGIAILLNKLADGICRYTREVVLFVAP